MTAAHTVTCTACHMPVKRYNAVIRGDAHQQNHWHPACFTVARYTAGVEVPEVVGTSLTERLAIRRAHAARR